MVISCQIEEITLEGDYTEIDSVQATCSQCHHTTESYGTSTDSIKHCLALMREECPQRAFNYYVDARTYNASIRKQQKTRKQLTPELVELLASMEYHLLGSGAVGNCGGAHLPLRETVEQPGDCRGSKQITTTKIPEIP